MRRLLDDFWDLSCIGMPAVSVVGVPAALVAGATRRWTWAGPLLGAAAVAGAFTWWPRRRMSAPAATDGVRIVAANLWYQNGRMADAAHAILALEPDVVIASELGMPAHDRFSAALAHHQVLRIGGARGHGVYSRFPLERLEKPPVSGPVLHLHVGAPVPFRLFAAHLPRASTARHRREGVESVQVCREEVFELAGWLDRDRCSMLAGDLNLTDRQPGYRRLVRGRFDAMRTVRARNTFRGFSWRPLAMRIDHMIVPTGWAVSDARAVDVPGSDHRAITALVQPTA